MSYELPRPQRTEVSMIPDKLIRKFEKKCQARRMESTLRKKVLLEKGGPIFRKYDISLAILFGSVIDVRCTKDSDIDLFVKPLSNESFWQFRRELEESLDYSVDLYTDRDEEKILEAIAARGETIYEVQP